MVRDERCERWNTPKGPRKNGRAAHNFSSSMEKTAQEKQVRNRNKPNRSQKPFFSSYQKNSFEFWQKKTSSLITESKVTSRTLFSVMKQHRISHALPLYYTFIMCQGSSTDAVCCIKASTYFSVHTFPVPMRYTSVVLKRYTKHTFKPYFIPIVLLHQ